MSQRIFGAILLMVCVSLSAIAWGYQAPFAYEPVGPRAYPLLLLVLIMAGAIYLLVKPASIGLAPEAGHDEEVQMDRQMLIKASTCVGLMLAYAALFESLGFVLSTVPFGLLIARLYGARWSQAAVIGVIASVGIYLLFDYVLDVPLPLGVLALLEI